MRAYATYLILIPFLLSRGTASRRIKASRPRRKLRTLTPALSHWEREKLHSGLIAPESAYQFPRD